MEKKRALITANNCYTIIIIVVMQLLRKTPEKYATQHNKKITRKEKKRKEKKRKEKKINKNKNKKQKCCIT